MPRDTLTDDYAVHLADVAPSLPADARDAVLSAFSGFNTDALLRHVVVDGGGSHVAT